MEEPGKERLVCLSVQEVTRWVNQYLSLGGYSSQLVTDLAEDMADGITLLRLVQAIGERWCGGEGEGWCVGEGEGWWWVRCVSG